MAELDTIDVELKDLKIVKSVFARHLPYKQVWAYGSRVKWTATETSDLDCVVFGATDSAIADAKEAFDESDIAFEVQLLNWETIPDDFKENIKELYFILQNKNDWRETTLGEIAEINPIERLAKGTNAPKITMDALQPFTKKISSFSFEEYHGGTKFRNGDTLVARITPCLENGKTAYVNILKDGELAFGSTEFIILRQKPKKSDKNFLYYFSTSPNFRDVAILAMTGSSGRQRVQTNAVASHLFRFPSLPEQKAIASVLSSLDDKIDLLHRQNKTLESIAETLFRQWFIEEAQGDWEEGKLGDICNITGGYAFKSKDFIENGVPVVKIKNISNNRVDLIDKQFVSQDVALNVQQKFRLTNGDIVMAMTGATIGKIGLVNSFDYDFLLLNQRVAVIKGKYQALLWFLLNTINLEDDITNESNGAAQANISANGIASVKIPKIYKKLAQEFNLIVEPIFDKILKNQKQIKTLESLRDTLLPQLISGNIRVKYEATA